MSMLRSARRLLLAGSALLLLSAAARAELRYVSSTGSDAKNCKAPAAACRSLQRAINVAPAGGEVRILDSGHYGNGVLIQKAITLSAGGETVMLRGSLTIDGFAAVTLRGLSLNGRDAVGTGVRIVNANAVHIDDCTIEHFTGNGIESSRTGMELFVTDSVSRENGGNGLQITSSATARLVVDNSRFENNGLMGIQGESAEGTVTRAVTSGNAGSGIWWAGSLNVASSTAGGNSGAGYAVWAGRLHLESSAAHGNGFAGLLVRSAASVASISNFAATGNGTGIFNEGGTVLTRQNNTLDGNTTAVFGAQPTPLPPI